MILAFTFLLYGAYYFVDRRFGFPADAALDGAAAVAIAQGVAADSLARHSTYPLLTAPGLTVIQVAASAANR